MGTLFRALPMWMWGVRSCTFDECSYKVLAKAIASGEGFRPHEGWLWAPGYPHLVAVFELFDEVYRIKRLQLILAVLTAWMLYDLGRRMGGLRVGRAAALLFALHPTFAYFTGSMFSESVYSFLLVGAVSALLWAREGAWSRALVPGALLAACVLFRGVATFMAPVFLLALVWPEDASWREALARRWRHAVALVVTGVALVGPYSVSASRAHGGLVIADATLGQVMYVGNNDFPVHTYDYATGLSNSRIMTRYEEKGRPHCDYRLPTAAWNQCEVAQGLAWIRQNPGEFLRRVPLRLAQLLNPNSFLTRHIRTGKWYGLPWWLKEALCLAVVATTLLVTLAGALGAWSRERRALDVLIVGIVVYHLVVIGSLFGLTRFRVPIEHLWLLPAALVVADPRTVWARLRGSKVRLLGAGLTLAALVPLLLWFLPTGFPLLWR